MAYTPSSSHTSFLFSCLLTFASFHPHASSAFPFLTPLVFKLLSFTCAFSFALFLQAIFTRLSPLPCYLIDFCCTEAEGNVAVTEEVYTKFITKWRSVKESNLAFQEKVLLRSGIGNESYAPMTLLSKAEDVDLQDAREETENLISVAAKRLLQQVGIEAREIDIVVINCSLFNPTPSLSAFLVHALSMRSNVKTFNLAGMGCSAGLLSISLAKDLLKVHRNSYALVLSTENITSNTYFGNQERSMMVANALFRCGCAAILLTNKRSYRRRAKLQLLHCLRTHLGADEGAFNCVHHLQDNEGKPGVVLQPNLVEVAGSALRRNITKLAPSILPLDELIRVVLSMIGKKVFKSKDVKVYEPNFKRAIDHFCIHPGGRAVIDSIGKGLKLSSYDVEPGKMALNRFGNTSSSGIWYALAYCEAKGRLRKGDKVWQIALGSGFKCNSGVWRVLKNVERSECSECNPWLSSIDRYPPAASILQG
ncbi:hypothetical protein GOP47_0012900 [Adiantum capillus-veneris]|uniref:3-ketoacyl-CoA synthase n=1 Tax=Adiantum capillus-veneris TaxID=13818 RepID=A0A9D4URZ9_ADICA|nr:hypothetical protein GOP47_0012900 [Adiantum capillus-veneris]